MSRIAALRALAERWSIAEPAERANAQSYVIELCHALGVEPPRPAGSGYEFEFPVKVVGRDGTESTNFVDLYKARHFALEAKDQDAGRSNDLLLRKAFGQVRTYVGHLPAERPPYVMVLDVGRTLIVWDRWNGDYGGYNAGRRIDLTRLADSPADADLLHDIWANPANRDPRSRAVAVTKDIAAKLAKLASDLEKQGYEQERVARFLMRLVFTMFAEDVELLPGEPFRRIIEEAALANPEEFIPLVGELWQAMDKGGRFLLKRVLHFNGHFFADAEVLPLSREALALLLDASRKDWKHVEPSIFGTLLTRALDPVERHRLGAEYTPREYVERVVRPTVEEPVRDRWTQVQAEVLQLRETGKKKDRNLALRRLRDFHGWMCGLRVLDPACGSGNFLYVTLAILKEIEMEVFSAIEEITGQTEMAVLGVHPSQFHGIEVKPWAREIAELTLWIGYHQAWFEHHGHTLPPEPVLQDTGTLELRDAVLAWEQILRDPSRSRPDPTPRMWDSAAERLVPDPNSRLPYEEYLGARQQEWPEADYIVGNPPYLGDTRMRSAFGDGYVEALRASYPELPTGIDYVMYWWYRAAIAVASGRTQRAGLITTNTIRQSRNRRVIEDVIAQGVGIRWAIPDHPWVDESDAAAVRVAITVVERSPLTGTLVQVDEAGQETGFVVASALNADLTTHADVSGASTPLLANAGIASMGFALYGSGFILEESEATRLLEADPAHMGIIRPYLNGRDLAARPRGVSVIDFGLMTEDQARAVPVLYDIVRTRVKPSRDANNRRSVRENWWQFGWPRPVLREALSELPRYIATPETTKHRFFTFLDASVAPDNKLVCIGLEDAFHLGVLSSTIHVAWSLAAGGRLGAGNDPVYVKSRCFDPFPFPAAEQSARERIADVAERLDQHRKDALARDRRVSITAMYNVVQKMARGEELNPAERRVHQMAACGVLRDLHEELDRAVAQAYGWNWALPTEEILERLVALHTARVEEEGTGVVRWLRPEYQLARFGGGTPAPDHLELEAPSLSVAERAAEPWPSSVVEQIAALQRLTATSAVSVEEAASSFQNARRDLVERHLDTLAILGELRVTPDGRYHVVA